jgi:hypothetical protein
MYACTSTPFFIKTETNISVSCYHWGIAFIIIMCYSIKMQLSKSQFSRIHRPLETIRKSTSEHYPLMLGPENATYERYDIDGCDSVAVSWQERRIARKLRSDGTFYQYSVGLGGLDGIDRIFYLGTPYDRRSLALYLHDSQGPSIKAIDENGQERYTDAGLDEYFNSLRLTQETGLNEITPELIDSLGTLLVSFVELQQIDIEATRRPL